MKNRLADETSPYLLQHADNPVAWHPWGEDAFAEARARGCPVLLSVGYAACHWCHVMAHESFENSATAEVMNRLFVNIKVDREERPDIDHIYMSALHALGQQGGWPLTMFLTPDGKPFWGGTYFPPSGRYGRPGFVDVLSAVAKAFDDQKDVVAQNMAALSGVIDGLSRTSEQGALTEALLDAAADRLAGIMDPVAGGLRGAPKFPQSTILALLLRQSARRGDAKPAGLVLVALERMSNGGLFDHLAGGFARYCVDERWLVPHFEKMLYDNAQLLPLLARAYLLTGEELFRRRALDTAAWMLREMTVEDGAFASSLDADTGGEEGATYLWSREEIETVLGTEAGDFAEAYDVTIAGNFEGRSILNRLQPPVTAPDETAFDSARRRLLEVRDRRPQPGRDDKVLADWNGLAIAGLATAGRLLDRRDLIDGAARAFRSILATMADGDGRLAHSRRGPRLLKPGLASDHAAMALAAVALQEATGERHFLDVAATLLDVLDRHYRDDAGLYRLTADDAPSLIVRPLHLHDDATPGHHGVAVEATLRLYLASGDPSHLERADRILGVAGPAVAANIVGGASLLAAFALRLDLPTVAVLGPAGPDRDRLAKAALGAYPDAVHFVAESVESLPPDHPAAGKIASGGPLAYVCRQNSCSLPISDPDDFRRPSAGGSSV